MSSPALALAAAAGVGAVGLVVCCSSDKGSFASPPSKKSSRVGSVERRRCGEDSKEPTRKTIKPLLNIPPASFVKVGKGADFAGSTLLLVCEIAIA